MPDPGRGQHVDDRRARLPTLDHQVGAHGPVGEVAHPQQVGPALGGQRLDHAWPAARGHRRREFSAGDVGHRGLHDGELDTEKLLNSIGHPAHPATVRGVYRVIQWGPGAVGTEMMTAVLDHRDDLQLVGAKVYSEDKNGVDIATLAGRDPIGVPATTDAEAVLALEADCVLYTPRTANVDDVCALLASGKNVATTAFMFHPQRMSAADRDRVLAACEAGASSVHGSGINPGNLSGVLPLALSGMSRTVEKITLQERADWSVYESTGITFDNMAFGQPVEAISPTATEFLAFNSPIFAEQVWFIGDSLGARLDEVTATVEAVAAQEDHQIFDHLLRAGTTAGQRWNWTGRRDGVPLVEIETLWTVGGEHRRACPVGERGHRDAGAERGPGGL